MFGFLNTLYQLLRYKNFSHIVAVADSPQQTFRKIQYPQYKAHRKEMPQDLLSQIQSIQKNFSKLGIPLIESPGYEADDIIASLVNQVRNDSNWECYIFSADKDLLQIIDTNIWILQTPTGKDDGIIQVDSAYVLQKWGVSPQNIKTLLALMGDASDNVPGVLGIGKKTAQDLVLRFGDLQKIYQNLDCNKPPIQKKLSEDKDNAFLSLSLVTLEENVPNLPSVDSLRPQKVNSQELWDWFSQLDLIKILQNFYISNDSDRLFCITDFLAPSPKMLSSFSLPTIPIIEDFQEFQQFFLQKLHPDSILVLFLNEKNDSIQVLFSQEPCLFIIPSFLIQKMLVLLEEKITSSNILVTSNSKFWIRKIEHFKISTQKWNFWDVLLTEYFFDSTKTNSSLEQIAIYRLGVLQQWIELVPYHSQLIFEIFFKQRDLLNKEDSQNLSLLQIDFALTKVLVNVENTGVLIDSQKLLELSLSFGKEIDLLKQQIFDLAGKSFNIASPKQLQEVLFTVLQIDPIKKKKTGFSTDNKTLEQLLSKHPITHKIIRFRFLEKLRNTTTSALPSLVSPITNRIHTQYHQNTVATGRLSSSSPNLQNIPIRKPEGLSIRKTFIAPPNHLLVSLDYSQVELRILAKLSQDPNLLSAFSHQQDIHTQTAKILFPHVQQISSNERQIAKTINFSIIYGISAHSLSQDLKIYVDQANKFINSYFQEYKKVRSYMEETIDFAQKFGFVKTFYGRKRFIDSIQSSNTNLRKRAERMAFNNVIQGTASDIIKKAMIKIFEQLGPQKMVMQVHDELVFYLPTHLANQLALQIKSIMENIPPFQDILQVDFSIGPNWGKQES